MTGSNHRTDSVRKRPLHHRRRRRSPPSPTKARDEHKGRSRIPFLPRKGEVARRRRDGGGGKRRTKRPAPTPPPRRPRRAPSPLKRRRTNKKRHKTSAIPFLPRKGEVARRSRDGGGGKRRTGRLAETRRQSRLPRPSACAERARHKERGALLAKDAPIPSTRNPGITSRRCPPRRRRGPIRSPSPSSPWAPRRWFPWCRRRPSSNRGRHPAGRRPSR